MILSQYVELLLDISLSLGLVKFVQLALGMCGGSNTLVQVPLSFIEFSFASNEMLFSVTRRSRSDVSQSVSESVSDSKNRVD